MLNLNGLFAYGNRYLVEIVCSTLSESPVVMFSHVLHDNTGKAKRQIGCVRVYFLLFKEHVGGTRWSFWHRIRIESGGGRDAGGSLNGSYRILLKVSCVRRYRRHWRLTPNSSWDLLRGGWTLPWTCPVVHFLIWPIPCSFLGQFQTYPRQHP